MKPSLFAALALVGLLAAHAQQQKTATCVVTVKLIDEAAGREIPGMLRITDANGTVVPVTELLPRGLGVEEKLAIADWFVLPRSTTIALPAGAINVEAISGLELEAAKQTLDLAGRARADVTLRLRRFSDLAAKGWRSGNTHVHLMKITREQSDRYLKEVPLADGLDAVFVSYLERAVADRDYITNRYTKREIASLGDASPVKYGNGEEHRHNFDGFGEGYGHVMLLDINELVQPVSIGPGITKAGTDGLPLARGIEAAKKNGATIIWCHDRWGVESVPNFIAGRVQALNIADGGLHGSFKDSFYRFWNAGIPVTFSTGTDWFIYDFSRVYADLDGDVTIEKWLAALRTGRTFITNGPLLTFRVNGKKPGETVKGSAGGMVEITAEGIGRSDFGRIELVRNGEVIAKVTTQPVRGHFEAQLTQAVPISGSCWFALRTPPPSAKDDPTLAEKSALNEFGKEIFAHTTPVSVEVDGRRFVDPAVCRTLLAEMESSQETIARHGKFSDDAEKQRVLDVYRDAIKLWRSRID